MVCWARFITLPDRGFAFGIRLETLNWWATSRLGRPAWGDWFTCHDQLRWLFGEITGAWGAVER